MVKGSVAVSATNSLLSDTTLWEALLNAVNGLETTDQGRHSPFFFRMALCPHLEQGESH